jgi:hypothetical protein
MGIITTRLLHLLHAFCRKSASKKAFFVIFVQSSKHPVFGHSFLQILHPASSFFHDLFARERMINYLCEHLAKP